MSRHFATLAYTPGVRAAQRHYNGGELPVPPGDDARVELGPRERDYIAARDSFYLATVSETGWPHVQHRGGEPGFLKVLDAGTLAFADCRGNRQYVSVGNLGHDNRAALILMDYPSRRRLKILGCTQVVDLAEASPALLAAVLPPDRELPVERILIVRVAAFDWNCSQYITPRYSESEWQARSLSHPDFPPTPED